MKVLSLKEPWASLISEKIKVIETRSWKTNYRGELYIHASLKKINQKDKRIQQVLNLLEDKEMKYGHIIAKCTLADCAYMDQKFINSVKKNKNEYLCGHYEIGRYGWIVTDVEILSNPIPAKGQLGIWNYN